MTLYFTDSAGVRTLVADDIDCAEDAITKLLAHQQQRYIYQTGALKVKPFPKGTTFTNAAGEDSGYILEK